MGTPPSSSLNSESNPSATPENPLDKMSVRSQKQLVSFVKDQYQRTKNQKLKVRQQWDVNLAMYGGQQYTELLSGKAGVPTGKMGTPASPRHRERSITNRLRPIIRTEITKLTSQKPSVTVVPASGEDDDLFAAQAGEDVWAFLMERLKYQWTIERAAFWASVTGNGFIKTWWDPSAKDTMFKTAMGVPTVGNIQIKNLTPYHLFTPDPLAEDIEDQAFVIEAFTKPVEWARQKWQKDFTATSVAKNEIFEASYFKSQTSGDLRPDSVLVIQAWIKPGMTSLLKEGGLVTVCGDELVGFDEGIWYSHEEFPYAHFGHIPTGMFWRASPLEDLITLQKEFNKTRSQIIESKNRMARPQLLAPIGSMDINKYTSEPGLIIPYKPGLGKPEPLPLQPIPNYVLQEIDRIISDMEDISGQHQVSRGMAPGQGVVAATAIAYLQEKDDAILSPTISSFEQGTAKVARHALTLAVDFWDVPRIIRITGMDRSFDTMQLKGSDIANALDVRVEPGSALPQSKAARQAFLMDLMNAGAITPQQMLDMMQIGGVQTLVDRMRIDMRAAQRENLRMRQLTEDDINTYFQQTLEAALRGDEGTTDPQTGLPTVDPANLTTYPPIVPVNKYDNHEVHITTHNNFRKTQAFEMLSPTVKDQFEKHIAIHESYVYMKMMNPGFGEASAGLPQEMMGMTPEMQTGPDEASSMNVSGPGAEQNPNSQMPPAPAGEPPVSL